MVDDTGKGRVGGWCRAEGEGQRREEDGGIRAGDKV